MTSITTHTVDVGGHRIHYRRSGPDDGPLVLFIHGWPEQSLSWRHQLSQFGAAGFLAVAPDMRGYGGSTVYDQRDAYAQELVVADVIALLDSFERQSAVWVGHDWGSATVWNVASHHPERCAAVASLSVPYATIERGLDQLLSLVDRSVYPLERFPLGQWAYWKYYSDHFDEVTSLFDSDPRGVIRALMRRGEPAAVGLPGPRAAIYEVGGWFDGAAAVPQLSLDEAVLTEHDLDVYTDALERNGFFGPDSYYLNDAANLDYVKRASKPNLTMPTLFVAARYDITCESLRSGFAEPMVRLCSDLTRAVVDAGHWVAQEDPTAVNVTLRSWMRECVQTGRLAQSWTPGG